MSEDLYNFRAETIKALGNFDIKKIKIILETAGKSFKNLTSNEIKQLGKLDEEKIKAIGKSDKLDIFKPEQLKALGEIQDNKKIEAITEAVTKKQLHYSRITPEKIESLGKLGEAKIKARFANIKK